jgi:CheY-like chemotaxis protein
LRRILRDCGYKVIEAVNSEEAMTVILHQETVVHLVFSDVEMAGAIDGFGLAKWIRDRRPGLGASLAGTVPRTVENAKELCEEGPVPKPYEANIHIASAVEMVIDLCRGTDHSERYLPEVSNRVSQNT